MNSKNLIIKNYPKMVQEFAEENFNLKTLSASLLVLSFILSALIVYLIKKGPDVIALDAGGDVAKIELKITDAQIVKAAQEYLSNRYAWKPESLSSQLKKAEWFVEPTLVNAFQKSMLETQRFVREKKVTQRVYPSDVKVDLKEKKIIVIADRITEFDSLTAATKMKVVLDFTSGERTAVNPWGIYIRKETEGDLR